MDTIQRTEMDTPIGRIELFAGPDGLTKVRLPAHRNDSSTTAPHATPKDAGAPGPVADGRADLHRGVRELLERGRAELEDYFAGRLQRFSVPLAGTGTPFQRSVWRTLLEIPFGEVRSYGWVAKRIGREGASRAVGSANGRNPLAIIVPCHRVIGANGALTGYGGGLEAKRWLLEHEGALAGRLEAL